jgi:TIR domain
MPYDVFISHSSQDKPIADAVCAGLEQKGIRCWIAPRDIQPGTDWGESIIQGIHMSRALVLVFTAHANASLHIRREVERAVQRGITVIPLRVEDILPEGSLEYNLSTVHWLDALTPPLEDHINRLAETVCLILQQGGTVGSKTGGGKAEPVPVAVPKRPKLWHILTAALVCIVIAGAAGLLYYWQTKMVRTQDASPPKPISSTATPRVSSDSAEGDHHPAPLRKPAHKLSDALSSAEKKASAVSVTNIENGMGDELIVGCWGGMGPGQIAIRANGTFVSGSAVSGQWEAADSTGHSYYLHFPDAQVYGEVSADGRTFNETGWVTNTVTRLTNGPGIVGTWSFPSGLTMVFQPDGTFAVGAISGKWRLMNQERRSYTLTYPGLLLATKIEAGSQRMQANDARYGVSVILSKVSCLTK